MEEIINRVIYYLTKRASASISLPVASIEDERILLYHKYICVEAVTLREVEALEKREAIPWVQWIDTAIAYGCEVTLRMNCTVDARWHGHMIWQYPLIYRDKYGRRIYGFCKTFITAEDVRTCEKKSIVLLQLHQRLTALARDELARMQVTVVEGVNTNANW